MSDPIVTVTVCGVCGCAIITQSSDETGSQHGDYADCIRCLKVKLDEQMAKLDEVRAALGLPV